MSGIVVHFVGIFKTAYHNLVNKTTIWFLIYKQTITQAHITESFSKSFSIVMTTIQGSPQIHNF